MKRHQILTATMSIVTAALAAPAVGQHADTVLFGDPNPDGLATPAEERFVHPLTSPYFHEDAFITSDVRAWALYHDFPGASLIGGGKATVAAVQLRLALTDTIQLVAYKDGYADIDTGLITADGLFDVGAGIKFNLIQDWEESFHLSVGVGYEIKMGDAEVLQNDDEWRFWGSVNKGIDNLHLGATLNFFLADDKNSGLGNSDRMSWHIHADYFVNEWFSPVVELNGYHTLDEGLVAVPFQGTDIANLGGGEDEEVITMGLGAELRPSDDLAFRVAYEMPLTHNDDLWGYRWTFSAVFSF